MAYRNYIDYSEVIDMKAAHPSLQTRMGDQSTDIVPVLEKNISEPNFPVKLHYMLSELEDDGLEHIASWQPHGRCILVHKPDDPQNGEESHIEAFRPWNSEL